MCSVVGCDSWRRGAQRFKLPEDPERRLQWVQFVLEVNGQLLKESSWTDITICGEHFSEECFERPPRGKAGRLELRPGAVPSHVENGKEKWTDSDVRVLLSLYGTGEAQLESGKRNMKVYASISEQMAARGVHRTAKQCREKIKKLKQDYKKVKEHNMRNGYERKTNKWYEKMDAILGHKPEYATGSSAVGTLETPETGGLGSPSETTEKHIKTEVMEPEEAVSEEGFCNDAPSACSMSTDHSTSSSPCPPSSCTSPPRPSTSSCQPSTSYTQSPPTSSSPRPVARKRKREDSSLQSLVKELLKKDEEDRRTSQETMQQLLALLNEQNAREAEERERQRAEAAEDRRRQDAFHKLLGMMLLRFSAASQQPTHPALD